MRVYNRYGRRDNMYKARIKILVKAEGQNYIDAGRSRVQQIVERDDGAPHTIPQAEFDRVARVASCRPPALRPAAARRQPRRRRRRRPAYRALAGAQRARRTSVPGSARGDAVVQARRPGARRRHRPTSWTRPPTWPTAFSRRAARHARPEPAAALGARRTTCRALWQARASAGFATPNIGLLTDMIACPGGDFCALANARSIPIAEAITERFQDLDELLRHRRDRPAHQRLHQLLRPPPQRPHRHPRRRQGRQGVVPGHARRLRRLARSAARRSPARWSARRSPPTRCPT